MSVFAFRLARLLRVREIDETFARERWHTCEHAARAAESEAERRRVELASAENELRAQQSAPAIEPSNVMASARLVESARASRRTAFERARTARFQAEELRRAWNAKLAEVKGLERLEERDRESERALTNAVETAKLDEVALMRAAASKRTNARRAREQEPDRTGSRT